MTLRDSFTPGRVALSARLCVARTIFGARENADIYPEGTKVTEQFVYFSFSLGVLGVLAVCFLHAAPLGRLPGETALSRPPAPGNPAK